ncbi:MAG: hypothetical protein CMI54_04605 [Parcubacteria group bacterium]|nr:hypothetical protein [Parcubacteria group bacterium]|tara:strand:+ start:16120 stop:17112 length:993 start_codon:yes stop_codon:yes gene_type:complete
MSLEELKRKNAEEELESQEEPKLEQEDETEAVEEESEEAAESEGSDDGGEAEEESIEAWKQSDDQTSQDSEVVPLNDLIKMRQKLKGKVSDKNEEIEKLKQEVESLKAAPVQSRPASNKPKREDFLDRDDPEEAYIDALSEWKFREQQEKSHAEQLKRQQDQAKADLDKKVEDHYQRAAKLLDEHSLSSDVYEAADSGFRKAVDAAFPGKGDALADTIISQIGEGSEKLIMYVGNNAGRREQLKDALTSDPNGLKAMRLIGKWESEMVAPTKRASRAPKPPTQVKGDAAGTPSADRLKKRYQDAHKSKDAQKAFNIKREAKAQNIDVSNW